MNNNDEKYWPALKAETDGILLPDSSVKPGLMFGYPAYYVNGKLAICHYERGVALKLPVETVHKLQNANSNCEPFCPMGKKMGKNWMIIYPDEAEEIHDFSGVLKESVMFLKEITE